MHSCTQSQHRNIPHQDMCQERSKYHNLGCHGGGNTFQCLLFLLGGLPMPTCHLLLDTIPGSGWQVRQSQNDHRLDIRTLSNFCNIRLDVGHPAYLPRMGSQHESPHQSISRINSSSRRSVSPQNSDVHVQNADCPQWLDRNYRPNSVHQATCSR